MLVDDEVDNNKGLIHQEVTKKNKHKGTLNWVQSWCNSAPRRWFKAGAKIQDLRYLSKYQELGLVPVKKQDGSSFKSTINHMAQVKHTVIQHTPAAHLIGLNI